MTKDELIEVVKHLAQELERYKTTVIRKAIAREMAAELMKRA